MTQFNQNADFTADAIGTFANRDNPTDVTGFEFVYPTTGGGLENKRFTIEAGGGVNGIGGQIAAFGDVTTGTGLGLGLVGKSDMGVQGGAAEMLIHWSPRNLSGAYATACFRWDPATTNSYRLHIDGNTVRLAYYQGASPISFVSAAVNKGITAGSWFWTRCRVNASNQWSLKTWSGAFDAEPGSWDFLDGADTNQTVPGWWGPGTSTNAAGFFTDYDFCSTANGGDAAPGPGTSAPVLSNPSISVNQVTDGGSVLTAVDSDRAGGTVYSYVSANATETQATIRANAQQTNPGVVGTVSFPATVQPNNLQLFAHFSQEEGGEDSNVENSTGVTIDTIPAAITFPDLNELQPLAVARSTAQPVTGINVPVTFSSSNGLLDVNADDNFQSSRVVSVNDTVRAQHVAAGSYGGQVVQIVTPGEGSNVTFTSNVGNVPVISAVTPGTAGSATLGNSSATFATGNPGTWYAAIYADGATPTHAQIRAGTGAVNSEGALSGAITGDPQTVTTIGPFSGLSQTTTYRLFVTAERGASFPAQPPMQFASFTTTSNQVPNITEQLTVTAVGTSTLDFQMTATDPDDANITYGAVVYPSGTNPTDAQVQADAAASPPAGGVPNPNPRSALWGRQVVQAQGTRYSDTASGLGQGDTYDVEAVVFDSQNPPTRFTTINVTMGIQGITQETWQTEGQAPFANKTGVPWAWFDTTTITAGTQATDNGTLATDATGQWTQEILLDNSTLPNGQQGTLISRFDDGGTMRIMAFNYTKTVQAGTVN